jgi:DUF2892 family protein
VSYFAQTPADRHERKLVTVRARPEILKESMDVVVIGLALITYAIPYGFEPMGWVGGPPLTAIFGFCPGYTLFGVSTCPAKRAI